MASETERHPLQEVGTLTLQEVMADLDEGWDRWAPEGELVGAGAGSEASDR